MLLKVYDSPVCDRREEGHAFVPPDPSMEHQGLPTDFDRTTEPYNYLKRLLIVASLIPSIR